MSLNLALVLTGDAASAVKALGDTDKALAATKAEAEALRAAYGRADSASDALAKAQAAATAQVNAAKGAFKAGTLGAQEYQREVLDAKTAVGALTAQHREAVSALRAAGTAYNTANDNVGKTATTSKLAAHQVGNLANQFADVAIQLQAGQKPSQIFLQQGSQIAAVMGQAGIGVGGLAKEVGGMAAGFARAHPLLTALAAAAGVAYGALELFTAQVNAEHKGELDAYAKSLGLTKKEIEELGGAAVTAGDMMTGLWTVIKEGLGLDVVFVHLSAAAKAAFYAILSAGRIAGAGLYAAIAGSVDGSIVVWKAFPGIVAEAAVGAANAAIAALERMINKAVAGINVAAGMINAVMGTSIARIGAVDLGRIENSYAGAGRAAMNGVAAGYRNRYNEMQGAFTAIGERISDATIDAHHARLSAGLEDAVKKAAGKGSRAHKAAGDAGKDAGKNFADEMAREIGNWAAKLAAGIPDSINERFAEMLKIDQDTLEQRDKGVIDARVAAQEAWNAQIERTIALLDQVGGAGRTLGSVLAAYQGLSTGDFSGVGGPAGVLLQQLGNRQVKYGEDTVPLYKALKSALDDKFGDQFGDNLLKVFNGAATGTAAAQMVFGSKANLGGTLGGAVGGAFADKFGSMLSKVAGSAVGAIGGALLPVVGGLLGNLVGGLFKSTRKGSATFDAGGLVGTAGNSQSRISAAKGLGGQALSTLEQIAGALGATLGGDLRFSVGVRNKNLVYDPTGQGRTKGAGTVNFGQDEAGLLERVIRDHIAAGTFQGLSAGVEKLIKGGGDLQKQLAKAGLLQGVMAERDKLRDPQGAELKALDAWKTEMAAIFTEAGEDIAALEEVYGGRRKEIVEKYAAEALSADRDRRAMEARIMELSGDAAGALAAARALELEGMTEALRPLQQRIWALEDEAQAAAEVAAAEKEAAERIATIAADRHEIELQLMEATGRAAEASAIRQADALALLDPSLRGLTQELWDAKAAADATAASLAAQAKVATDRHGLELQLLEATGRGAEAALIRRADALAELDPSLHELQKAVWDTVDANDALAVSLAAQKKLVTDRHALEIQLLEAQGRTAEAQAIRRADALDLLDPSLRGLQQAAWDAADANDALALSLERQKKLVTDRHELEIKLLEATGRTAEAEAIRRADALGALDPSLRGLQQAIWDAGDAADALAASQAAATKAAQAHEAAINSARADLTRAYEQESAGLIKLIERFGGLANEIALFRDKAVAPVSAGGDYGSARRAFRDNAWQASLGNEGALSGFNATAQAFLDASLKGSTSWEEHRSNLAEVTRAANGAIGAAQGVAGGAGGQLALLAQQVDGLIDVKESTLSVAEALDRLETLQRDQLVPAVKDTLGNAIATMTEEVAGARVDATTAATAQTEVFDQMLIRLDRMEATIASWDRGGSAAVATDADRPIATTVPA